MEDLDDKLIELLAKQEHSTWSSWMEYMLSCAVKSGDDTINIRTCGWPTAQFEAWQRLIETDYEDLTKQEKDSDRKEAINIIPEIKKVFADTGYTDRGGYVIYKGELVKATDPRTMMTGQEWYDRLLKELEQSEKQSNDYSLDQEDMTDLAQALRYDNAELVWSEILKAAKRAASLPTEGE